MEIITMKEFLELDEVQKLEKMKDIIKGKLKLITNDMGDHIPKID